MLRLFQGGRGGKDIYRLLFRFGFAEEKKGGAAEKKAAPTAPGGDKGKAANAPEGATAAKGELTFEEEEFLRDQQKKAQLKYDREATKLLHGMLKKTKGKILLTRDNYRIDCGMLIDRAPIYLHYDEHEMNQTKYRYKILKKYKLMMGYSKDLIDFVEKPPFDTFYRDNIDTVASHEQRLENGEKVTYSMHSKYYAHVDPTLQDRHSIQYAPLNRVYLLVKSKQFPDQWTFPSFQMEDRQTFEEAKANIVKSIFGEKGNIHLINSFPVTTYQRDLVNEEKEALDYKKVHGVRTYYFAGTHMQGQINLNPDHYLDWAWVPKQELSKFMDEKRYNNFIHYMSPY